MTEPKWRDQMDFSVRTSNVFNFLFSDKSLLGDNPIWDAMRH